MKKILMTMIFMGIIFLNKTTFSVVNVHQPGSAAWHAQNQMLQGALQAEQDRINQERQYQQYLNQQYQQTQSYPAVHGYSIVVWNDKTGVYITDIWDVKYDTSPKKIVNALKKKFKEETGETANKSISWKWENNDGNTVVVVMGRNIKNNKWEIYYENYGPSWEAAVFRDIKEFDSEAYRAHLFAYEAEVERRLLSKCREKAEYCQTIYSFINEAQKRNQ